MDVVFQSIYGLLDTLIFGLSKTYGLDWLTMVFGLIGGYYIAKKDMRGILFNILACSTSFSLAIICDQYGFIIYNLIFITLMLKAYKTWSAEAKTTVVKT